MFDLFNRVGKIGIGCAAGGMVLATLGVLAGVIIGGIAADLPAWVIVLICAIAVLFELCISIYVPIEQINLFSDCFCVIAGYREYEAGNNQSQKKRPSF